MKINVVRCDACKKDYLINLFTLLSTDGTPYGWFVVKFPALLPGSQMWTFCSQSCLTAWATKQQQKEVEV